MGWHHRPGDRVRLVYRNDWSPWKGRTGTVRVRARPKAVWLPPEEPGGKRRRWAAPLNFLVELDDGTPVIVPGGNLRGLGR